MTGRVHTVRAAVTGPVEEDRKPVQRGQRRGGPDCNRVADILTELASTLWLDKWSGSYGGLGSLVGAATRKSVQDRVGLAVVCVAAVLHHAAPPGAGWELSLTTCDDRQPVRLVMLRDGGETRHAVPVRLSDRSLRVGLQPAFALTARDAGEKAIRAIANEAGAFFGAPVRSVGGG